MSQANTFIKAVFHIEKHKYATVHDPRGRNVLHLALINTANNVALHLALINTWLALLP